MSMAKMNGIFTSGTQRGRGRSFDYFTLLGVDGRMFNWIRDFMMGRSIQVRVGSAISKKYLVENGTPQGSVISPVIFSIVINDVFENVSSDIGRSLFADDGALWKRGRNGAYVSKKMQEAISKVEEWATAWGFRFSVAKTKSVVFFGNQSGIVVVNLDLLNDPDHSESVSEKTRVS